MRTQPLYQLIASIVDARIRCQERGNTEWHGRHSDRLKIIERELLPRGSGIDRGTTIDLDRSTGDKIVLHTSYHHMDEGGGYAGWTAHTVTVRPSLIHTIDLTISGRNRNDIKDYLYDVFHTDLTSEAVETVDSVQFAKYAQTTEAK